ncbi:MAG: DUF3530 family protein [Gammaproteobacteria bacterium]|nr:DUF3530 family protein [Gammaproteobacteria bacterium]
MKLTSMLAMLFWLSFSLQASVAEQQMPISKTYFQMLDIQHFVKDKEIKILNTGEQDFLALVKEQTTGFSRGIAFIIPDINQPVAKQAAVNATYDQLNDYGWTSILLTMPSQESIEPPINLLEVQAELAKNPEQETNLDIKAFHQSDVYSEQFIENIEEKIEQRLNSAMELAKQHAGFYLFICEGKSCAWLTSLLQQERVTTPDALVMLGAHIPQADLNQALAMRVSKTEFPVLELYQDYDSSWVTNHVTTRRKLARKEFKTNYRQRKVPSHFGYLSRQQRTVKEIYGFLVASGM